MGSDQAPGAAHQVEGKVVSIGLVADPDLPAQIADDLADELPQLLREEVDPGIRWVVSVHREPLPVRARPKGLIKTIHEWLERQGWDLAICLTDLPLHAEGRPVVAEASADQRVGLLSLPALGPGHSYQRARDMVVGLVRELLSEGQVPSAAKNGAFVHSAPPSDVHREPSAVGVRFAASPGRGTLRLLAGMVRANRPWRFVLGLLSALTASVATAVLANMNNNVWRVSGALGTARLVILTVASLGAMVVWLVLIHKLWRRPSDGMSKRQAALFNATTVLTLLMGVGTLYVGLFAFNLITGALAIPSRPLRAALGHSAGAADYLRLAWFVSSVATVGGALGSGLETNQTVRAAAYRYQPQSSDD